MAGRPTCRLRGAPPAAHPLQRSPCSPPRQVDLGWSPDDRLLASCSLDNTVCIWDPATGQRVRVLDYHTSFVKGLAWDPVGSYLATQVRPGGQRGAVCVLCVCVFVGGRCTVAPA